MYKTDKQRSFELSTALYYLLLILRWCESNNRDMERRMMMNHDELS